MFEISLNAYHAVALAAAMWWIGNLLTKKIPFLSKFCIPAPLVGGLLFAIVNTILYSTNVAFFSIDSTFGTLFMTMFFTSVGFSASFRQLLKGGKTVLITLVACIVLIVLQNGLGGGLMALMGQNPLYGIACGSLALLGGPGTAAAIGPDIAAAGAAGAMEIGVASATFGMIAGSVLGGPLARLLITRKKLATPIDNPDLIEATEEKKDDGFSTNGKKFVQGFLLMMFCMGVGDVLSQLLTKFCKISFPVYIGSMIIALIVRNVIDAIKNIDCPENEIETLGNASLNTFLAMSVSGMQFWKIAGLALPMIVCLLAQTALILLLCYFVLFRVLGKDYDAAVTSAGFLGMGMGTSSNAMVSMQAVTGKYGPSFIGFFAVPVAGLFADLFNAVMIAANIQLWA